MASEETKQKDDLVLVKMLAAPINPSAIGQIEGRYPVKGIQTPPVPGLEGVGVVLATSSIHPERMNVSQGDWVIPAISGLGMWREHFIAEPHQILALPKGHYPLEAAATLLTNPPTAYRLLEDFLPLKSGNFEDLC